jgi:hypothetical protein
MYPYITHIKSNFNLSFLIFTVKLSGALGKALKINGVFGKKDRLGAYRITHLQPGRPGKLIDIKMG